KCVALVEEAAANERNAECFEVVRAGGRVISAAGALALAEQLFKLRDRTRQWFARAEEDISAIRWPFRERKVTRAANALHTGKDAEAGHEVVEEGDALRFGGRSFRERHSEIECKNVLGVKAGVSGEDAEEAACEQTSSHQKHQGGGELRANDEASHAIAAS